MSEPSETTPLIPRAPTALSKRRIAIFAITVIVSLLSNLAGGILTTSIAVLYESAICRQIHPDVPDPFRDSVCKETAVQQKLVTITTVNVALAAVCGGLVAVPYGRLADAWGRKWVLVLSIASSVVMHAAQILIAWFPNSTIPLQFTWLVTGLATLAGGPFVSFTMLNTMACDVSTAPQRAVALFVLGSTAMLSNLISPFIVAAMLRQRIWLSLYIGFGILVAACITAVFVPESRDEAVTQDTEEPILPESTTNSSPKWFWRLVKEASPNFGDNQVYAAGLFAATACAGFATSSIGLLAIFGAIRYQWDFTNVAVIELLQGSIQSGVMLVGLPLCSFFMSKRGIAAPLKDLWLAKGSILAQAFGVFILGLATNEPVFIVGVVLSSLGIGSLMALRAALTNITSSKTLAVANAIVTAVLALSVAVAAIVWFAAFSVHARISLWVSGGLCIVALGILSVIRPADAPQPADE